MRVSLHFGAEEVPSPPHTLAAAYGIRKTEPVPNHKYGIRIRNAEYGTWPKFINTEYGYGMQNTELTPHYKHRWLDTDAEYGYGIQSRPQNTDTDTE